MKKWMERLASKRRPHRRTKHLHSIVWLAEKPKLVARKTENVERIPKFILLQTVVVLNH